MQSSTYIRNKQIESQINRVVAIVVTYNRKELLLECIEALMHQSSPCDVLIVDNASTDGTNEFLRNRDIFNDNRVHYLRLEKNFGGSGGFHYGIKYCMFQEWSWFWLMDDDAKPDEKALEILLQNAIHSDCIYGSVAVGFASGRKRLCFPAKLLQKKKMKFIEYHEFLGDLEEMSWIPFLGFFVHRHMVKRIGLPDLDFFILDDDVEYSERAKKYNARIFLIKGSIIIHPLQATTLIHLLGKKIYYRSMPPWKIYYDVRNKITVAKRYYRPLLWSQTIPGILVRAFYSIFHEEKPLLALSAYAIAILDGILNKTAKRFLPPIKK